MKILDALRTAALFLIAAGLFAMSFVTYNVMGKHGRYTPVDFNDDVVVVMDTHTGQVFSMSYELQETTSPKVFNSSHGKIKRLTARLDE